ncbi:potassium transporter Kup [Actinomycetospora sp.]|uniref:potassium transporter Kup n=1 Tax=Actinomycetospora sp. TaxID=1872135 RepID=UPI002F415395
MADAEAPPATTTGDRPTPRGRSGHPSSLGAGATGLALGALGVVFGDIGTSPLYAMQTVFSIDGNAVTPTPSDVYGVVSLIFWSVTVIVTIKYVTFMLRADNDGEGGVMALAALVRRTLHDGRRASFALALGVLGAALFYGDSLITPAISVLSAVEGVEVVAPELGEVVLPLGAVVLTGLFVVQRAGTERVGRLFGPVMAVWFVVLAALGLPQIVAHPEVLAGLSPTYIVSFFADHPFTAFIAMGAVVLAITGAEALYADMGHFGRRPIRRAWFMVVFPALIINYLGQGALILHEPAAVANPFYLLAPGWARIPLIVLATAATVIASQAVISGAFSVSQQAVRLGYLPRLTVRHTSASESGQIYVPTVNWLLFGGVLILVATFQSSSSLATAYGLAVTGTLLISTTLFLVHAATAWHWPAWRIAALGVVFGGIELLYFAANLTKVTHGGWLPLLVATIVIVVMTTWQRGRRVVTARRTDLEGPLRDFLDELPDEVVRVPGTAVFPHPTNETAPLALRANVEFNHVLHERVVIVSLVSTSVPHVPADERLTVDDLEHPHDGIVHVSARFGFQDVQDVPGVLRQACALSPELANGDPDEALYYISRISIERGSEPGMRLWRKRLFVGLAHNAASPAVSFRLPTERTVVMGSRVEL